MVSGYRYLGMAAMLLALLYYFLLFHSLSRCSCPQDLSRPSSPDLALEESRLSARPQNKIWGRPDTALEESRLSARPQNSSRPSSLDPALDESGLSTKRLSMLDIAPSSLEAKVMSNIPIVSRKRFLPANFPMPAIELYVDTAQGCLIGEWSCAKLIPSSDKPENLWPHDPHNLGFVKSALMGCVFRDEPCFAIDIGANFGFLTLSMLHLNTRVVSVEPQLDLCASLMASVQRGGLAHRSTIRCGAVASSSNLQQGTSWLPNFNFSETYRYDGKVAAPFSYSQYGLEKGVPVVKLDELLPPAGTTIQMLKIDTDSIDCDILWQQLLPRLQRSEVDVRNICFESSGCSDLSTPLHEYQKLGFTVFRTLLWQVHFDSKGSFPEVLPHEKPQFADWFTTTQFAEEVFDLRFNRYLWRFRTMPLAEWKRAVAGKAWQYFLTREVFESIPYRIDERS